MAATLAPGARFVDPAVLARVGNLEFVARSVVDGVVKGLKHPQWPDEPWEALRRLALMLTEVAQSGNGGAARSA